MNQTYTVRCSDCGSLALRTHCINILEDDNGCPGSQTIKTECPSCDYLLITCSVNGKVIDAHSSTASIIARKQDIKNSSTPIPTPITAGVSWSEKLSA